MHHLKDISLLRRCDYNSNSTIELHIFTDTSPQAYGAVAYLRGQGDEQTTISLVMAKMHVASLKTFSLPQLELLEALIGAWMCAYLEENLAFNLNKVTLWTDFMIAFYWLKGLVAQWKPFVANRVVEIQEKTNPRGTA